MYFVVFLDSRLANTIWQVSVVFPSKEEINDGESERLYLDDISPNTLSLHSR